ncbi:hypothetical protein OH77DRAFT_1413263 [Trametes cingulata]|nr:hypothetical protein OH77DRAFT_1413263 [Trametes cingulata]
MLFPHSLTVLPAFIALAAISRVTAHGWVANVTIDGKTYQGNAPGQSPPIDSPIREISENGPVKDVSDPTIACGLGAQVASQVAAAAPGSNVSFHWVSGSSTSLENWIHIVGPIMTYLAPCEGTTCDKFDASQGKWFKIAQAGTKPSDTPNAQAVWYQHDINDGKPYTVQLPPNLKAGQYLIRNEIIGLQGAMSPGGAEFYPSCTQLDVSGTGTGVPDAADIVSFPGAYKASDSSVVVPDAYNPGFNYTRFPGPPVAELVSGDAAASGEDAGLSSTDSAPESSSSLPPSSASATSSASMEAQPTPTTNTCTCGAGANAGQQADVAAAQPSATATATSSSASVNGASASMGCSQASEHPSTLTSDTDAPKRRRFSRLVRKRVLERV